MSYIKCCGPVYFLLYSLNHDSRSDNPQTTMQKQQNFLSGVDFLSRELESTHTVIYCSHNNETCEFFNLTTE